MTLALSMGCVIGDGGDTHVFLAAGGTGGGVRLFSLNGGTMHFDLVANLNGKIHVCLFVFRFCVQFTKTSSSY